MIDNSLLYVIPEDARNPRGLTALLDTHPEVRFVSFVGVDLGGNDTDERIPISLFRSEIEEFLSRGIQTDGSSVVLAGLATLNNAKVDLIPDPTVRWYVDYNLEHRTSDGKPVGTLRIPSFLEHEGEYVDSRAQLQRAIEHVKSSVRQLIADRPEPAKTAGFDPADVADVILTSATELEMWVRTPGGAYEVEQLSVSQVLQEQYWKRTKGSVRTALEESLAWLEVYGLQPEMGHKEVGGVKANLTGEGRLSDVMEQIEIDWKYAPALQAADNELIARIVIKEVFRRHGLEVTYQAKPIEGVAGSGEHTHISLTLKLRDGSYRNLFSPTDPKRDFLSVYGWGALMGLLRNYEVVAPFVTCSNDAFNRLKPGFEAPVCIVSAVGHTVEVPSRNRTVLAGLVRDPEKPLATRFELRAPHPHTNTYLALAAVYSAMLDGIRYAVTSGQSTKDLEAEFSKEPESTAGYLEQGRQYRSEEDVFEHFTAEERDRLFGQPPATVWEMLKHLDRYPAKREILSNGDVLRPHIVQAYRDAMMLKWTAELLNRVLPDHAATVRSCVKLHGADGNELDEQRWEAIQSLRCELTKDDVDAPALFTRIRRAVNDGDYATASALQLETAAKISDLKNRYGEYSRNILN
ncbi:MAG: glutamine synthetase [Chloroflexi bacterium]|nr:glutamine synthetase [Chloroflexota bacterium]